MRAPRNKPTLHEATRTEIQPGIWLDSRLAVWFAPERLLVVADLHWGYVASHRARGNLLPWWGDDELETRLRALLAAYQPAEMIWLGDVVHAAEGAARADEFLRATPTPVTLIAGNHDRRSRSAGGASASCRLLRRSRSTGTLPVDRSERGQSARATPEPTNANSEMRPSAGAASVTRGRYFFHHGDTTPALPPDCLEVIGHHHPAASWWDGAGSNVKVPGLVAGPRRLVLPAFSPWAAGTPWISAPAARETVWAVTPTRIFPLPRAGRLQPSLIA